MDANKNTFGVSRRPRWRLCSRPRPRPRPLRRTCRRRRRRRPCPPRRVGPTPHARPHSSQCAWSSVPQTRHSGRAFCANTDVLSRIANPFRENRTKYLFWPRAGNHIEPGEEAREPCAFCIYLGFGIRLRLAPKAGSNTHHTFASLNVGNCPSSLVILQGNCPSSLVILQV